MNQLFSSSANLLPYTFEDKMSVLRFISICFVVWGHCLLDLGAAQFNFPYSQWYQTLFLQLGRIGTINFFIITGYFLGEKVQFFTLKSYIEHRSFSLILPWIIFLGIFVLIEMFKILTMKQVLHESIWFEINLFIRLVKSFIFDLSYWFVPASLFSSLILILFKKQVYSFRFGIILASISLFYCVNLYYSWIPAAHTKSFLAYTFFMWLGLTLKLNLNFFKDFLKKMRWMNLALLFSVAYILACTEGLFLLKIGSKDPFGSTRLSNEFVSIILLLAVLKSDWLRWITIFNPRKYTFGIYLIHFIIIALLDPVVHPFAISTIAANSFANALLLRFCFFVSILFLSALVVKLIKSTHLKFILGK